MPSLPLNKDARATQSVRPSATSGAAGTPGWLWCATLGAFLALAMIVERERPLPLDATVKRWVETDAVASTRPVWLALSWPGEHVWIMLPLVSAASLALWRAGDRRVAVILAALYIGAGGTNLLLKGLVARPRPVAAEPELLHVQRYSFPSGHAVQYTCVCGLLAWWCRRNVDRPRWRNAWTASAIAILVLVGPSRVFLQVHWPTDVLAGYLYGYLWLCPAIHLAAGRRA